MIINHTYNSLITTLVGFLLLTTGCGSITPNKVAQIKYRMTLPEVVQAINTPGYLEKLDSQGNEELRHQEVPINHKKYDSLHLLFKDGLLENALLSSSQKDEWLQLVGGNKINFENEANKWERKESKLKFEEVFLSPLVPFLLLRQIGTVSDSDINNLKLNISRKQILNRLGAPHHQKRIQDFEVLTYENSRFIGVIVYNLYLKNSKLVKVSRSLLQSELEPPTNN